MRRAVLTENGMPTIEDNLTMARAVLSDAIASNMAIPPGQYYLPDEETFITSLTKLTNTIRTSIKYVARIIVQYKYDLLLDTWDLSSEVAHKQQIVPTLLTNLQCLFITGQEVSNLRL